METMTSNSEALSDWKLRGEQNKIRQQLQFFPEGAEAIVAGKSHDMAISAPLRVPKNHVIGEVLRKADFTIASVGRHPLAKTARTVDSNSNPGLIDVLYEAGPGILLFDEADKVWNTSTINTRPMNVLGHGAKLIERGTPVIQPPPLSLSESAMELRYAQIT